MKKLTECLNEGLLDNVGVGVLAGVKAWCEKAGIKNYNLDGGVINVDGDFNLPFELEKIQAFPYPFGEINGDFWVRGCRSLTSLENFPTKVNGELRISGCGELKSLKGITDDVVDLRIESCDGLKNMKDISSNIKRDLLIIDCWELDDLTGCPKKVNGDFWCRYCRLTSLNGCPEVVKGDCNFAGLMRMRSLDGCPKKIGKDFELTASTLTGDMTSCPVRIGKNLIISRHVLADQLKTIKKVVKGKIVKVSTKDYKNPWHRNKVDFDPSKYR